MFILTIYEIDEYGLNIHWQQASPDEGPLQAAIVEWTQAHYPDHFDDGLFHDSPSFSVEDNYQAIMLWSQFSKNAGRLRYLLRLADRE